MRGRPYDLKGPDGAPLPGGERVFLAQGKGVQVPQTPVEQTPAGD